MNLAFSLSIWLILKADLALIVSSDLATLLLRPSAGGVDIVGLTCPIISKAGTVGIV
jgi:hypothetical protein